MPSKSSLHPGNLGDLQIQETEQVSIFKDVKSPREYFSQPDSGMLYAGSICQDTVWEAFGCMEPVRHTSL